MSRPPLQEASKHNRSSLLRRVSSTPHYQTFPTKPPKDAGRRPAGANMRDNGASSASEDEQRTTNSSHSADQQPQHHPETPLPKGQLAILAVISLAEQTALNSISPYLPAMAASFPEVKESQIGLYVGLIASAFALAQFATNFLWGLLSDRVGRKPIVLVGTFLTAVCFVAFGFCRTLWQAILVQALMGLVNGNQGVISTCLGEITDRSNQSRAFTYLPVIYGLGGITGPLLGGLMVLERDPLHKGQPNPYPYLLPNLFSAAILLIDFVLAAIFLRESLETAHALPPLRQQIESIFAWLWQFNSSHRPTYIRRQPSKRRETGRARTPARQNPTNNVNDHGSNGAGEESPLLSSSKDSTRLTAEEVLNRDTILLLTSYLIFQLSNISYNSLYPIFSEAKPPTGRNLGPSEIGTSLAFAGVITIVFQVGIFGRIRDKAGNKLTYRAGLACFVVSFLLMPWVGYKDGVDGSGPDTKSGEIWLWIELGGVLIIKTVAAVGGLTSALLLITNSAPSHAVLGTLNGLAQTLSAAGRALGPFISGALFSAATHVHPKGEALAFGIFAGIAFLGFLMSLGIRGADLEAEGFDEEDDDEEADRDAERMSEERASS